MVKMNYLLISYLAAVYVLNNKNGHITVLVFQKAGHHGIQGSADILAEIWTLKVTVVVISYH